MSQNSRLSPSFITKQLQTQRENLAAVCRLSMFFYTSANIACLVRQALCGQMPTYLADDIHLVSEGNRRSLRSSSDNVCGATYAQQLLETEALALPVREFGTVCHVACEHLTSGVTKHRTGHTSRTGPKYRSVLYKKGSNRVQSTCSVS